MKRFTFTLDDQQAIQLALIQDAFGSRASENVRRAIDLYWKTLCAQYPDRMHEVVDRYNKGFEVGGSGG